jgi:hypothetical protein
MWKLILGAAFAVLAVGPALAADIAVRPADRRTVVSANSRPMMPRTGMADARSGSLCWTGGWLLGSWRPCPRPAAVRTARAARIVRASIRAERAPAAPQCTAGEPKKQYWATSLSGAVNRGLLQGLQDAVAQGEVGWLDVNPEFAVPVPAPGTNLIFYHVGGNCYAGRDCERFPSSTPAGDRWGNEERELDLDDPQTRKIVVADLVILVQRADERAPKGAVIGVHLDNVHRLDADGLARIVNEYLQAVDVARQQGLIGKDRTVGYVAKNNAAEFKKALDRKRLRTAPLYQISENAALDQNGALDENSRAAQELGRRYNVPVFLKTFGTDVAYTVEQAGNRVEVLVTQEMTRQMARMPNIAGAAWSPDEARYQPIIFAPGAPVRGAERCEKVASR